MKKITLIAASKRLLLTVASVCFIMGGYGLGTAMAQEVDFDAILKNYTNQYILSDDEHRATKATAESEAPRNYIYEELTVKNLSHLFWAVGLYKFDDEEAISEFMRINECEIYKNYFTDELEWQAIKDATVSFLKDNKEDFPTRFEFIMPIKLENYIDERQAFEIQDEYKFDAIRRFEVYATDFRMPPCTDDHRIEKGFPRVLVLEFSRPFSLEYIPMSKKVAVNYLNRTMARVNLRYKDRERTRARILDFRDAYLVLKIKIFTHGKFLGTTVQGVNTVQMLTVLEGFEIYDSLDKDTLFYAENYVAAQNKGKLNEHLKSQYELLQRKHKGEGLFH
jgi:hypothetical protein